MKIHMYLPDAGQPDRFAVTDENRRLLLLTAGDPPLWRRRITDPAGDAVLLHVRCTSLPGDHPPGQNDCHGPASSGIRRLFYRRYHRALGTPLRGRLPSGRQQRAVHLQHIGLKSVNDRGRPVFCQAAVPVGIGRVHVAMNHIPR